jgi:putative FmdB family regulatory protein
MPIYEYECSQCGHRSEELQRISDPPLTECPECGGEYKKLISAPAFQFKGSGWYVTDYARKESGKGKKTPEGEGAKGEEKGEKKESAAKKEGDGKKAEKGASKDKAASA